MLKILSLRDFDSPTFGACATSSFANNKALQNRRDDCSTNSLSSSLSFSQLQDTQPLYLQDFPPIVVTPEMLATRETGCTIGARDLFLPVQDSAFKKIVSIWREKGTLEAIRTAALASPGEITRPLHWLASRATQVLELIERGTFWSEILPISSSGSVAEIVQTRDYNTALIRCVAWHPGCPRLAVATRDDRIRVYSSGNVGTAVLRHSGQKSVCCMSWRPNAGRELAAACWSGVLIWSIELGAASNSLSHAVMLKQRNHSPVTNVAWSPQGDLLVSCSSSDVNTIIWDVSRESGVPLRRVGGGGLCFVRWSSCGSRLLTASCRRILRVWNIGVGTSWTSEKWTVPQGRVAAACFGPNLTLLFVSNDDPGVIFSLPLQEQIFDVTKVGPVDDNKVAVPLIDLSKVVFSSNEGDEQISVGGRVVAMDWDHLGKYLAVIFQDSPLVALFKTKVGAISRITEVRPLCFVKGFPGEVPNCIQFYKNKKVPSDSTVLTIAWSSGNVQHFPILESSQCEAQTVQAGLTKNVGVLNNTFSIEEDPHATLYSSFTYA